MRRHYNIKQQWGSSGVCTILFVCFLSIILICWYYNNLDDYYLSADDIEFDGTATGNNGTAAPTIVIITGKEEKNEEKESIPTTTISSSSSKPVDSSAESITVSSLGDTGNNNNNSLTETTRQDYEQQQQQQQYLPEQQIKIPLPVNSNLNTCTSKQLWYIQEKWFTSSNQIKWLTNCPADITAWMMKDSKQQKQKQQSQPPIAIYVGCNKGLDAINTLRILSKNTTYDKQIWSQTMNIENSACNQHMTPQFPISTDNVNVNVVRDDAIVYCIEAMPSTFNKLNSSLSKLNWNGQALRLYHAAISNQDDSSSSSNTNSKGGDGDGGGILFPNARVGTEELGISHCNQKKYKKNCELVPQYRLDTLLQQKDGKKASADDITRTNITMIDILSIDVEGYDYYVLMGATNTIDQTRYIEFEYNSVGPWMETNLSTVIEWLSISKGFVCYWSGNTAKQLWRITGCFLDIWDVWKQWSNIACVHPQRSSILANRMELNFIHTLQKKGYNIEDG